MLPEPALTLTLPSIHDATVLDCRIYHPASLLSTTSHHPPPWSRHAAVVAHPYAPMGGSYDDPIVETVAAQLLRKGYLVGTFNFRGAGASAGSTSWTGRPERGDFGSVVGFLVYYVHHLDPFADMEERQPREAPVLLMAGYSYGAMVATQLPPLGDILQRFEAPAAGSEAAQIRARAEELARQQNAILGSARAAALEHRSLQPRSPRTGVRVGGGDVSPRRSHDSWGRRSFSLEAEEKIRRGVSELIDKTKGRHVHGGRKASGHHGREDSAEEALAPVRELLVPRAAYLLISPLQGFITHLATMSLLPSSLSLRGSRGSRGGGEDEAAEAKLVQRPTLAVYGDRDVFVGAGKLRAWAGRLQDQRGSRFEGCEVRSAGHFWAEEGVLGRMERAVAEFAGGLVGEGL
ncbi:hypothetical protein S7711_04681 [Stachybotrys chartarum IBT 7711]|jgi:alpha/beta superfamily hydrolase|uniref:Xaa-Pro dipeptidyl-peptidase-like domain-containing protein n=1 Tax=Stachybotrys chartarum (strain CBS 109288 / IBT 7711) TaxID=1280523 RepID=A0A084B639_STACB|nr:hypothetical protein S7711_04681 [Stachybotrys chartarum IBT 7711]KFA55693.1 hypothetical protein S40293_05259 [Stachybotrys chartarum IBT 40293]